MTKICRKCLLEKEVSLFPRHKNYKDGYENSCKKCVYKQQSLNRSRNQKDKVYINKLSLQDEIRILKGIRNKDSDSYYEISHLMRGLKRWTALKHRPSFNDPRQYEELLEYLEDKMMDRILRFSKKPERRRLSKRTGRPSLVSYLAVNMRYDCIHFVTSIIDRRYYQNRRHFKVDRRLIANRLTSSDREVIDQLLLKGDSPYKIARQFSLSKDYVFLLRRKLIDPEGYRKYIQSNYEQKKARKLLKK